MPAIINSFITTNGNPATGLTPTIRIWEVTGSTQNLIIGAPNGSYSAVDGIMTEVTDSPSGDGFYKFEFTDIAGYSNTKHYLARIDAGIAVPTSERWQVTAIDPMSAMNVQDTAAAVWDATASAHITPGTTGEKLSQTAANVANLVLDMVTVKNLVDLILKYDTNRTKIDPIAKTLTIYENDCTTPLRVFQLLDSTGNPSVTEVCERKPIAATDGKPTCP